MDEYAQRRLAEKERGKSFFCFVKKEVEEEQDVAEEEEEIKKEPEVPPTTKVSSSTQTDLPSEASQSGSSHQ